MGIKLMPVIDRADSMILTQKLRGADTFEAGLAIIDNHYIFTPVAWNNNGYEQKATDNEGSQKMIAFLQILGINSSSWAFFKEYWEDVKPTISSEDETNHLNIRLLYKHGTKGVTFNGNFPLQLKEK